MSSEAVRISIHARLVGFISSMGWNVPVIDIENIRGKPPATTDWACIEYIGSDEQQITTGAPGDNVFREDGDFLIHYVVPSRSGSQTVINRLDLIRKYFRATLVDEITIDAVSPPDTQNGTSLADARGNWWGGSISINYKYDCRG